MAIEIKSPSAPNSAPGSRTWWLWVAFITIAALAARLTVLWANTSFVSFSLGGDEPEYRELALQLAQTGRYQAPSSVPNLFQGGRRGQPTAYRTPVFPLFLAVHYRLFGRSDLFPHLTIIVLSAATCLLLAAIGKRLVSPGAGLTAALIWAIWPPSLFSWYGATGLLSENLGIFLLVGHIFVCQLILKEPSPPYAALSGVLLGFAVLTRAFLILFIPFGVVFFVFLPIRNTRERIQLTTSFLLGLLLVVGLWTGRNWMVVGRPVVSTQTEALYLGNNQWARGSFCGDMFILGNTSPQLTRLERKYPNIWTMGEIERSEMWKREGIRCVLGDPPRFAWLLMRKTLLFWGPFQDWSSGLYRWHYLFVFALVFFSFGLASLILRRDVPALLILLAPILSVYGACLITYTHDRYRYVIEPFVILIAAAGMIRTRDFLRSRFAAVGNPSSKFP